MTSVAVPLADELNDLYRTWLYRTWLSQSSGDKQTRVARTSSPTWYPYFSLHGLTSLPVIL